MAVATNAATKAFPPPSSAFSELLRRSRFASYDPTIIQTYSSPQAHARRGDYGLKRPIPMPYKDSYITVNQFEHHAQFTEWNNADAMVKFVKRVEETNVTPRPFPGTEWDYCLGDAKNQWLLDSEFAENTDHKPVDGLGRRGQGAYGARRSPPQQYHADSDPTSTTVTGNTPQLNIMSLSPPQFKRYLGKLRQLSPEYRDYLLEQQKTRLTKNLQDDHLTNISSFINPKKKKKVQREIQEDDSVLFVASQSQFNPHKFHRPFLAQHFSATSPPLPTSENKKITTQHVACYENVERQPHRTAGLMYTHYSPLETVLTTHPQPGFILQHHHSSIFSPSMIRNRDYPQLDYIALLGGLAVLVKKVNAGTHSPFYVPDHDFAVGGKDVKANADAAAAAVLAADKATAKAEAEARDTDKVTSTTFETRDESEHEISTVSTSTLAKPNPLLLLPPDSTDPLRIKHSLAKLRLLSIVVRSPPKSIIVASNNSHLSHPKNILKSVSLSPEASVDMEVTERFVGGNPYRIGSMEYSGHMMYDQRNRFNRTVDGLSYVGYGGVYGPDPSAFGAASAGAGSTESYYYGASYTKPMTTSSEGVLDGVMARGTKYTRSPRERLDWSQVFEKDKERKARGAAAVKAGGAGVGAVRNGRKDGGDKDGEDTKKALENMIRSGSGKGEV